MPLVPVLFLLPLSETTTTRAELYWDGAISLWDMGTDDQTRTYWYDSSAKIYQSALELFGEAGGQSSSRDEFELKNQHAYRRFKNVQNHHCHRRSG